MHVCSCEYGLPSPASVAQGFGSMSGGYNLLLQILNAAPSNAICDRSIMFKRHTTTEEMHADIKSWFC